MFTLRGLKIINKLLELALNTVLVVVFTLLVMGVLAALWYIHWGLAIGMGTLLLVLIASLTLDTYIFEVELGLRRGPRR